MLIYYWFLISSGPRKPVNYQVLKSQTLGLNIADFNN